MSSTVDVFQQPAGTLLAAHLPNYGSAWTIPAPRAPALDGRGAGTLLLNTAGIWSPLTNSDPTPIALTAPIAGAATVQLQLQMLTDIGAGEQLGPILRYQDASNWYACVWNLDGLTFDLLKMTPGGLENPAQDFGGWDPTLGGAIILEALLGRLYAQLPNGGVIDYTDPAPLLGPGGAGICYRANGASASATTGTHASQFVAGPGLLYPLP